GGAQAGRVSRGPHAGSVRLSVRVEGRDAWEAARRRARPRASVRVRDPRHLGARRHRRTDSRSPCPVRADAGGLAQLRAHGPAVELGPTALAALRAAAARDDATGKSVHAPGRPPGRGARAVGRDLRPLGSFAARNLSGKLAMKPWTDRRPCDVALRARALPAQSNPGGRYRKGGKVPLRVG